MNFFTKYCRFTVSFTVINGMNDLDINIIFFLFQGPQTTCPLPYVESGQQCFLAIFTKQGYTAGLAECTRRNGFLAKVDTQDKITALTQYMACK